MFAPASEWKEDMEWIAHHTHSDMRQRAAQLVCDCSAVYKIKVGRGQGDGDIGTRVWGLGTWGRETRDLRTSSMGRGDVKNRDAGDAGCEKLLQKSEVNAISVTFLENMFW